ncbi:MAG: hypothetical protein WD995_09420 [Gemmatimonadota bacterium]
MSLGAALLWGFVGTVVLTSLMAGAQGLGLSRMNIPFLLGTMFTPSRDRATWLGAALHLMNGWIFALVYIAGFEALGLATWWLGAAGGALHAFFLLAVLMPLMPSIHPRMVSEYYGPTVNRQVQPPGFLGLNYGRGTALAAVVAHLCYGAVLGGFYAV